MSTLLSKNRELELGSIIQGYLKDKSYTQEEAQNAFDELFEHNKVHIYALVKKFLNYTGSYFYPFEDAVQDAFWEMTIRIWQYDPTYNTKFITRAYYNIWKKLSTTANKWRPAGKLPDNAADKLCKIHRALEEYDELDIQGDRFEYACEKTKMSMYEVANLLSMSTGFVYLDSEDQRWDSENVHKHEMIESSASYEDERVKFREILENYFEDLTDEEINIVKMEYMIDNNKKTVLKFLKDTGMTKAKFQERYQEVLEKLRKIAIEKGDLCY